MHIRWLGYLLGVAWLWSCAGPHTSPQRPSLSQTQKSIINGQPDSRFPAVGAITIGTSSAFCTGTLVTPKLVVTAAHCVDGMGRYGGASACRFRIDSPAGSTHYAIQQAIKHPNYNPRSTSISDNDIAVLILQQAVTGVQPIPANDTPITTAWIGRKVLVMGYGLIQTRPSPVRTQAKYATEIPIYQVSGNTFIHYDQQTQRSACHGDSGGPALYQVNGEWRLVGVTSTAYKATRNPTGQPPTFCDGGTVVCRPDAHYRSFLLPYINQTGGSCQDGQTRPCYSGPAGTQGVGLCKGGTQTCQGGRWSACSGEITPTPQEICFDQKDNNCNNQVDEGCAECQDGQTRTCYGGPPSTQGVGTCKAGQETCRGGKWSACEGAITPAPQELCGDGKDNDCDGHTDEGCCQEGATDACYTGPLETWGIGPCQAGLRTCRGGKWSACEGEHKPQPSETCGDGIDNDCDGQTDEGCPDTCQIGASKPCYHGPPGTLRVGICRAGVQRCVAGKWGRCEGEVGPSQERCGDRTDNDCDGQIDEGCNSQNPNSHFSGTLVPQGFGCQSQPQLPPHSWLPLLLLLGIVRVLRRPKDMRHP